MRWWSCLAFSVVAGCGPVDPCEALGTGEVCIVAGTPGHLGFNRDGLSPEKTSMHLVSAARRGPDGLLYLMDLNNQRLRVVDEAGVVETLVGDGIHDSSTPGVPAVESSLANPTDFAFLPDGRVVIVQYHDPRVFALDADGTLELLAGSDLPGERGDEGDGGPALSARFIQLDGIAIDAEGAIYVSDSLADRVRVIRDGMIDTALGTGLHAPTALEVDHDGGLLIADSGNHAVRRLAPDGTVSTVAGGNGRGFSGDGGPAAAAQLDEPTGIALDADGTLYLADRRNFRARRVSPSGTIDTIAGTGEQGYSGNGGPALDARFGFMARLSLDGDDLLVADQTNGCVRRIVLR